eukprot:scaffold31568_cov53-Cyclotella_meneghiniana.AAC.2
MKNTVLVPLVPSYPWANLPNSLHIALHHTSLNNGSLASFSWILGWARSTLGAVGLCDVDGVFTLATGVSFTLGTDCCS